MFQQPFFLHPPGPRTSNGIYINPMNRSIVDVRDALKDSDAFYLHSPDNAVCTPISHLFSEKNRSDIDQRTLTPNSDTNEDLKSRIKDISNVMYDEMQTKPIKCVRLKESVEEEPPYETVGGESNEEDFYQDQHMGTAMVETCVFSPPPPPPPVPEQRRSLPPSPKLEESVKTQTDEKITNMASENSDDDRTRDIPFTGVKVTEMIPKVDPEEKHAVETSNNQESITNNSTDTEDASSKADQISHPQESSSVGSEILKSSGGTRHVVLPFILPKIAIAINSEDLLKPSEYLRIICNSSNNETLSKTRSMNNLDSHDYEIGSKKPESVNKTAGADSSQQPIPPPPPAPDLNYKKNSPPGNQPFINISIDDLTSVQLRETSIKKMATKTFSAPPNRSASMNNVSETFVVQKTDLIAELKRAKDIPGIKKFKIQRAEEGKAQEQELITEVGRTLNISKFIDQIPEKDSSGNVIPIWKRQILAKKAAERAKKEFEEQLARENEERRLKSIPPWKKQLLAKKDKDEKRTPSVQPSPPIFSKGNAETFQFIKNQTCKDIVEDLPVNSQVIPQSEPQLEIPKSVVASEEQKDDSDSSDVHIIPWKSKLRKVNCPK